MTENRKLVKNVTDFLGKATDLYSRIKADQFSQQVFCELLESGVESPIEDIFYIACHVWCASEYIDLNPPFTIRDDFTMDLPCGIYIEPQKKIGQYKVDFFISSYGIGPDLHLIVELDGHDFHDKDKKQRSYEKARDRFFVKSGFKVLHYTGSDVVADPFKVTHECLCMVGLDAVMGRKEYVKNNPFGIE